jgi:DNA-binding HxlR family transcriptional regulator
MNTIQINSESFCPLRHILNIFSGKWKLPIVCMLATGKPLRYSSIKRKIGDITNVMLSQSLKELERDGIVHREQYNEVPPRVEYSLTDKGKEVVPVIQQAAQWAVKDMKQTLACGVNCEQCFTTK